MKELMIKITVAIFTFLVFCTFTAKMIEEHMTPIIEYAPIEEVSDFEIKIPTACIHQLPNGREGIFYVEKQEGLWGEELIVQFLDMFPEKADETTVTLQTAERRIVGYCSQKLISGMKVKKVEE